MSSTEYILVALTILVPLAIAIVVTMWTLEQARMRSKKNRRLAEKKKSDSGRPPASA